MTPRHRKNDTNDYAPTDASPRYYSLRQAAWALGISSDDMARAVRRGVIATGRRRVALVVSAAEIARHLPHPSDPAPPDRPDSTSPAPRDLDAEDAGPSRGWAWLAETLDALERYRLMPTDVLARLVFRHCEDISPYGEPPDVATDADLAHAVCAGCRAPYACLELELRLSGADTVGVWGGLSDQDARVLHRAWLAERDDGRDVERADEPAPGPMCARCDHSEWVHEAFSSTHAYVPPALDDGRADETQTDAGGGSA